RTNVQQVHERWKTYQGFIAPLRNATIDGHISAFDRKLEVWVKQSETLQSAGTTASGTAISQAATAFNQARSHLDELSEIAEALIDEAQANSIAVGRKTTYQLIGMLVIALCFGG